MMAFNMELSTPELHNPDQAPPNYHRPDGCVTRRYSGQRIEVWGEDISEHYLITLQPDKQPAVDCILIT